jgi:hypothetical protein
MGIAEQLNAMRRDHPSCRVATFADLSSGLVLFASTSRRLPQERLDALCARARAILNGSPARTAEALLDGPPGEAIVAEGDGLLVFVRSPTEPDEALICDCDPDVDLRAFTERATRELASLGTAP